jgi:hypothetical protein
LVPRHPPCALTILTVILLGEDLSPRPVIPVSLATVQFSRSAKRLCAVATQGPKPSERRRHAGLSKLNSMRRARSCLRHGRHGGQVRSTCLVTECAQSLGRGELRRAPKASASGIRCPRIGGLPRKEVIQPQLPLRLPCYDFTPVTSPTFDGSLPKGLGHRLRVLLTPMV